MSELHRRPRVAVLVSGESGAGKTEVNRLVVAYIVWRDGEVAAAGGRKSQYAAAGHLGEHLAARHRAVGQSPAERSGRTMADKHYKRMMVKQGITNNTTANGMKHYKNQSLNY